MEVIFASIANLFVLVLKQKVYYLNSAMGHRLIVVLKLYLIVLFGWVENVQIFDINVKILNVMTKEERIRR